MNRITNQVNELKVKSNKPLKTQEGWFLLLQPFDSNLIDAEVFLNSVSYLYAIGFLKDESVCKLLNQVSSQINILYVIKNDKRSINKSS